MIDLCGSHFAGANGPNGFVGNDNFAPVARLNLFSHCFELPGDDIKSDASFTLLFRHPSQHKTTK